MAYASAYIFQGNPVVEAQINHGASDVRTGLSAAGSTQATALPLPGDGNIFSTVAASQGAILLDRDIGDVIWVVNGGASALLVYPPVGGQINALAANAGFSLATGRAAKFVRISATRWVCTGS